MVLIWLGRKIMSNILPLLYLLQLIKIRRVISLEIIIALGVVAVCFLAAFILLARDPDSLVYYQDAVSHLIISRKVFDWMTPGLVQYGSVWLPMTHIMLSPLTAIDFLFYTGLAGTIVSTASTAVTAMVIFRIVKFQFTSALAGTLAASLYVLNPSVIYMGIIPMMEAPFMMFFIISVYYVQQWYHIYTAGGSLWNQYRTILKCGLAVSAASLTRYEGWLLAFGLLFVLLIVFVVIKREVWKRKIEAIVSVSIPLSFLGIFLWILWNGVIFKDPSIFATGPYSAQLQASARVYMQHTHFQPINTLSVLSAVAQHMYGLPVLILSFLGIAFYLYMNRRKEISFSMLMVAMLLAPIIALCGAMIQGSGEMWDAINGGWFNGRYLIFMAPFFAFGSTSLVLFAAKTVGRKSITVIVVSLVIISYLSIIAAQPLEVGKTTAMADSSVIAPLQKAVPVMLWTAQSLQQLYAGGNVVLFTPGYGLIFESGLPLRIFIDASTGNYWDVSKKSPWVYGDYLVMENQTTLNYYAANLYDPVHNLSRYWNSNKDVLMQHYDIIYENQGYEIMKKKELS
jgi:hypothetical protein